MPPTAKHPKRWSSSNVAKPYDDPLVMDKWFAVQASAPGPESVQTIRSG